MPIQGKNTLYHGKKHSAAKKGPGRFNKLRAYSRGKHGEVKKAGYPNGIEADARFDSSSFPKRLAPAKQGGNWQGKPYLSYSEHDACIREPLSEGEFGCESHEQALLRKHGGR